MIPHFIPFYFKQVCLAFGFLLLLGSCENNPDPMTIVNKSIEAHGGKSLWNSIQKIDYIKEIKLYDSLENLEQTILQKLSHQWNPSKSVLEWNVNGSLQSVRKTNEGLAVFENGKEVTEHKDIDAIARIMDAALYVFWQPFKLLDENTMMTYEGTTQLIGNQKVHSIRIQYSTDPKADVWHYYFDTVNFRLKATQVAHDGRISLIMNEAVEEETGLFLNKRRRSYFINPDHTIKYLRAAYDYTVISIEK